MQLNIWRESFKEGSYESRRKSQQTSLRFEKTQNALETGIHHQNQVFLEIEVKEKISLPQPESGKTEAMNLQSSELCLVQPEDHATPTPRPTPRPRSEAGCTPVPSFAYFCVHLLPPSHPPDPLF